MTDPYYDEFVAGATPVPGDNGWIVQVFRVPHPKGHVPVYLRTLQEQTWSPGAADELLKSIGELEPVPLSSWEWLEEWGAYGRRFMRPRGWGERRLDLAVNPFAAVVDPLDGTGPEAESLGEQRYRDGRDGVDG